MADEGVEFSGRTVEEAIAQAETYFGAARTSLSVQVITPGRSGVFGIGSEPARVRVQTPAPVSESTEAAETTPPATVRETPQIAARPTESESWEDEDSWLEETSTESPRETRPAAQDLPEEARVVLDTLLQSMGFDAGVSVRSTENPVILAVSGQNLGVLIGRRGDNLASLQFMVNLILSKGRRQWPRVVIDVENYRARREESLRSLADRIAYRVERNGRPFTLEAMPASDRRVIHLTLRERPRIETYSIGEGVSRRVVIAPIRPGGSGEDQD